MRSADFLLPRVGAVLAVAALCGCTAVADVKTAFGGNEVPAPVSNAKATPPAAGTATALAIAPAVATPAKTAPVGTTAPAATTSAPAAAVTAKSVAPTPTSGAAVAAPATATASATPAAPPAAEPPVSPEVQRAFDDARRTLRAGRATEAERAFQALARANPDLGGPHANLGLIYRQAGKLSEATAEFEQAVRLNPNQPVYFNELGITYRLSGAFAKAREAYEKAIALDDKFAAAHLNLGILFDIYLWDSASALSHYDRYMSLSPNGDEKVKKWIADIKNRTQQHSMVSQEEKQ